MENSIISFLNVFFDGLKGLQKWFALLLLIVIIMIGVQEYEKLTRQFELSKIERKTTLLKELQSISDAGIDNHPELQKIYQEIVSELASLDSSKSVFPNFITLSFHDSVVLGKAISGASFLIIVLVGGLLQDIKRKTLGVMTFIAVTLFLFSAIILAWIGTLIPTLYNPWVNYVGFPLLQVGIIFFLAYRDISKKKNSSGT
jgi:lysylphosphatidylglycerol synthetase-like protein (DUF2156 family)